MPKIFAALAATLILSGCSQFPGVYQIPVEQGNQVEASQLEQLQIGMTRAQVRFLLGTPAFINRLQNDRWIYLRTVKVGEKTTESSKLSIRFDGDVVSAIETDR
ncbi:outer membrane protein assembly factor BamE [Litorivicinus lipolyticus]|uniref:Outer membrane protein assembly factor BamE n=1 Tax=Litorivicinus lipolyticus TaxID=418701 RepID=A0A5Q2QFF5_9GAMM|nr:outer membrane protein assembly factor BamE [Litorivicinus lipolyticus]QGG80570.1 outer membrane protein assembly factor BamE [Litorivicinus lipolyticus]